MDTQTVVIVTFCVIVPILSAIPAFVGYHFPGGKSDDTEMPDLELKE